MNWPDDTMKCPQRATGGALDDIAEEYGDTKRRIESDDELRARILGKLRHGVPTGSVDHLDYVVANALHEHMSVAMSEDDAKEALVAHWLRGWLRALPWWRRLAFWWRLWRATRGR